MTDSDDVEVIIIISSKDIIVKKSEHCNAELSIASESNQKNGFQKVYSQLKINRTTKEVRFWIFLHLDNPRLVLCSIAGGGE